MKIATLYRSYILAMYIFEKNDISIVFNVFFCTTACLKTASLQHVTT